jgi:flagellar operon protein
MPQLNGISVPFVPAGGVDELKRKHAPGGLQRQQPQTSFKELFEHEVDKLKFSAHAQTRLNSREIDLSPEDMQKLEAAVQRAEAKGAKESLIMMRDKDMAFIVSIRNKTVITAMQNDQMKDNVFTNIDSAVFA